jgi:hypothetical protein
MSEYQYYEFLAIDRPLTEREMRELRAYSTRARITPTSFVNDYSWGGFKGDEDAWMEKYFDAFLYLANWGSRTLKMRLPARLLDPKTADLYCVGDHAHARVNDGKVILTFFSDDEENDESTEAEGILSSLISVRSDLARVDLRCLYLGWLLCAQSGDLDDIEIEPPVPAGLAELSGGLESFVDFLRVDTDLLDVAARTSSRREEPAPNLPAIRSWVANLPAGEKDDLLARFIAAEDGALGSELLRRVIDDDGVGKSIGREVSRRTAGELLREADRAAEQRRRLEAEKAASERAQRQRAAAMARKKHLDRIVGRESALWTEIESLIATRQPDSYDQAVKLLVDLRDVAARGDEAGFPQRLERLRSEHARKPALIERMRRAGL